MKEQNHLKEDQKKWTACELNMGVTAKGLNTHDHVIFQFLFSNKFAKTSTFLLFSVKTGRRAHTHEEQNEPPRL